ncbi:hypothetical protein AX16_000950 [Volvariella volvacea WC 439]|nr:hypothetical protein AX16_000950 [Volvariella volvacea WC 439]
MTIVLLLWMSRKIGLTIHGGEAFLIATPDKETSKARTPGEKTLDWLTDLMLNGFAKLAPAEQRKRQREVQDKTDKAVSSSLGDCINTMIYLDVIATDPYSQGRGYGGLLLNSLIEISNLTSRAIWLRSTKPENLRFYEKRGFRVASSVVIGDQNPEWHEAPVIMHILVREPGLY